MRIESRSVNQPSTPTGGVVRRTTPLVRSGTATRGDGQPMGIRGPGRPTGTGTVRPSPTEGRGGEGRTGGSECGRDQA